VIEVDRIREDPNVTGLDLERIAPACARAQQERVRRAEEIVERLNSLGVAVRLEDAIAEAGGALSVGRPHIARAAGAGDDMKPFFEEYLVPGAKAFVARRWPSAAEAVELIHSGGGAAVVALPFWDVSDPAQVRSLVGSLPVEGVESFYPSHTRDETAFALELCAERGLTPTGSSDFHGPTHKTFSRFGAYDTFGLGEPQVPSKPDG